LEFAFPEHSVTNLIKTLVYLPEILNRVELESSLTSWNVIWSLKIKRFKE